jgi:hypothetical protein
MFCCKIFIFSVLLKKYYFPPATVEFNSKQLSVETISFRTDNHSVESRKFKTTPSESQGKKWIREANITFILDIE